MTIGILGESGDGKTFSFRNCDPASTFIINADRKMLPFRGAKKNYKFPHNYVEEVGGDESGGGHSRIIDIMKAINDDVKAGQAHHKSVDYSGIRRIVIDTANNIMVKKEMADRQVNGFKKWYDLAEQIYNIFDQANQMHDDIIVYILGHTETIESENGGQIRRMKSNGRKLEKIVLESLLPVVLYTRVVESDNDNEPNQHLFEAKKMNGSTAKSPQGMFSSFLLDNDIQQVEKYIRAYMEDEDPETVQV